MEPYVRGHYSRNQVTFEEEHLTLQGDALAILYDKLLSFSF